MKKTYQCTNSSCTLGSREDAGLFTGGISKDQVTILTGVAEPPKEDYGQGICPNCGRAGKEVEVG